MEKKEKTGRVIAITGGICTGKSFVLNIFKKFGCPVFSCDDEIKNIKKENTKVQNEIKEEFPEAQGNEKKLAELVFSDKKKLKKLEDILLPELEKRRIKFLEQNTGKTVILEVPLLYEKKKEREYDEIIVTTCSKEVQKQRATKRGVDVVLLEKIIKSQIPISKKTKKANHIIDSEEKTEKIEKAVLDIYKKIENRK